MVEILIAAGMDINSMDYFDQPTLFSAISSKSLTDELRIKLLPDGNNLNQCPREGNLLIELSLGFLSAARELLARVPAERMHQYVNYVSLRGTALYCAVTSSAEQSPEMVKLLIEHGAGLKIAKPSHGTPLMGACYFGRYEMVALLLKTGARTTCKKADGTEVTAVIEARLHPEIVSLLKSFEERGFEALDEPKPARIANMSRVEECVKRIAEEKEMKRKNRNEEEKGNDKKEKKEIEGERGI
ncbi:hypothetical protein sscle_05g042620 [Sclerotinia sclerotiorum 1980 UF-70]|uniref:Uncharacterized protein n=1 Tax=Sclerotinia sclerotiorum (strain ATCC 18683 / 1980 / Ss-1) TaxID=665079 RepID=A0A1D9Q3V4_SCLS1|nr:hypothetical protein sscle_05g042620 [Sclerotinia sclerotiorum 1980 UF-70]